MHIKNLNGGGLGRDWVEGRERACDQAVKWLNKLMKNSTILNTPLSNLDEYITISIHWSTSCDTKLLCSSRVFSTNKRRSCKQLALQNGQGLQCQPPALSFSAKEPSAISRDIQCQLRVPPCPLLIRQKTSVPSILGRQLIRTAVSDLAFKKAR